MAKAFRLFGGSIKTALVHAFTQYDERQSKGARYNPYALAQYLVRMDEVLADIGRGAPIREALCAAFHGPLLKCALKAVGEPAPSKEELSGFNKAMCYCPVVPVPEWEEMGASNAETAIDQQCDYDGIEDALESYHINLGDTLTEHGFTSPEQISAANRAFEAVLIKRGIEARPHGL